MFQIRNCLMNGLIAGVLASAALLHVPAAQAATESVVYSFGKNGATDGTNPYVGLINVGGTLYGTTAAGGAGIAAACIATFEPGCGTVFKVDPATGAETVVYSFCRHPINNECTDGYEPVAGLINVGGTLYGTTVNGGAFNNSCGGYCGTVFKIDPATGSETVVYSFCSQYNSTQYCPDAHSPGAGLLDVGGTLYGTTLYGGTNNYGTVFKVNPKTGAETVVYSFQYYGTNGNIPAAGLIGVGGILYGTTPVGGAGTACSVGCGTVFSVNPTTGAGTMVYSFCSNVVNGVCKDGAYPDAGLIDVGGTLYGTTNAGGVSFDECDGLTGCGTVFKINTTTGAETVVYPFCSESNCTEDGAEPYGGLLNVKGTLYGTTSSGGPKQDGTVFKIDSKSGVETVLTTFMGGSTDGAYPDAGLINVVGTLYGTTSAGGDRKRCHGGCGTVFKVRLP